jgi:hypothetical protein
MSSAAAALGAGDVAPHPHANRGARRLYDILTRDPAAVHFKTLPDVLLYPGYYEAIARPVCLADINMAIASGAKYSVDDMARDLRRMLTNAKKFNAQDAPVYADALALEVRWAAAPGAAWGVQGGRRGAPLDAVVREATAPPQRLVAQSMPSLATRSLSRADSPRCSVSSAVPPRSSKRAVTWILMRTSGEQTAHAGSSR